MLPDDIVGDPSEDDCPGELGSREGSVVGESAEAPDELAPPSHGPDGVPREILGQRVIRIPGRRDEQWSYHGRIAVRCRNPAHKVQRNAVHGAWPGALRLEEC